MQLKMLIEKLNPKRIDGQVDREISSIAYDSRRVKKGSLFVALRGEKIDGHKFVDQAVNQGAEAVVSEEQEQKTRATVIEVENTRIALADLSAAFFQHPSHAMKIAGV